MLVVTTIELSKGFQAWKDMVHSVQDKMKEHGMTFVFAGTEKDDDTKLHTVIHFESEEHLISFSQDEELTRLRKEAGGIFLTHSHYGWALSFLNSVLNPSEISS